MDFQEHPAAGLTQHENQGGIALAAAPQNFPSGRAFAAWLGLTPQEKSTGGRRKLGAVSKRGERTIRRLLVIGPSTVIQQAS